MTNKQQFDLFVKHASLAFFASAWADQQEENGHSRDVYELIKVPYIEFGSYSLEQDYD